MRGQHASSACSERNRGHLLHRHTFARHYMLRNVSRTHWLFVFHVHSFCTALDGSNTPAFALTPYDPASCFLTHCAPALIVLGARMRTSAGGPAVELDQQYCKIRKHPTANALYDQHCQQPRVRCNAGQCTS